MALSVQTQQTGDFEVVRLIGHINEDAEVALQDLANKVPSKIIFNLKQVESVNSCGVRAWINFMRQISENRTIIFEECTPDIVMQINMIPSFKNNARVKSVYAPYSCGSCGNEEKVLFAEGKNLPKPGEDLNLPEVKCSKCSGAMEMQELEDEFFAFQMAA